MTHFSKNYISGFDSLRFYAALIVFISHAEILLIKKQSDSFLTANHLSHLGGIAVTCFFVLSGFLITYLFYNEYEQTKRINIRQFYFRRILRIVPLYYFIILLAFFLYPLIDGIFGINIFMNESRSIHEIWYYLLFIPQVGSYFYPDNNIIHHLWSIGVEVLFYLIWPFLILKIKFKLRSYINILVILGVFYVLIYNILIKIEPIQNYSNFVMYFFYYNRIECFIIGSIGALFFKKQLFGTSFLSKWYTFLLLTLIFMVALVLNYYYLTFNLHIIYSVFFCVVVLRISSGKTKYKFFINKTTEYLGKISYGFYMYHPLVLFPAATYISNFIDTENVHFAILLYFSGLLITVIISSISYFFMEKKIRLQGIFKV